MSILTLLSILDVTGFVFGASGSLCVGYKNKYGFLFFIIGSLAHGILGFLQGNYGLMATCLFFILVDIYFFMKWSQEETYQSMYLHGLEEKNAWQETTFELDSKMSGKREA